MRSSTPKRPPSDHVSCYGTIWVVAKATSEEGELESQLPPGVPHLTSPGLASTFLTKFFVHSTGRTYRDLLTSASHRSGLPDLLRRVGGSPHTTSRTYHLYDCGETLCESLSVLATERIKQIAANWNAVYGAAGTPPASADPPPQLVTVLTRVVELARVALSKRAGLRLRVDYRRKKWH